METTQLILEWWLVVNHCEGSVGESDLDASIKTLLALASSTVCISWQSIGCSFCSSYMGFMSSKQIQSGFIKTKCWERWIEFKSIHPCKPEGECKAVAMPLEGNGLVCGNLSCPQKSSWKNVTEGLTPIYPLAYPQSFSACRQNLSQLRALLKLLLFFFSLFKRPTLVLFFHSVEYTADIITDMLSSTTAVMDDAST